jgi:MoxR-like ATPase
MLDIDALQAVLQFVKRQFVGKDTIVDLLGVALVARENAFLLGPPGTAKSALVRELSYCIEDGNNFEYLLTRFTEPNELFGPFDIRKLQEGELVTNTTGMLPEAALVFLDEIFNANSAILNSLLTALNERVFRRGKERRNLPALLFVGASNQLPEEPSLAALLDRFLLRIPCDYVSPEQLGAVLQAGWKLATKEQEERPIITPAQIIDLQRQAQQVDLSAIQAPFVDLVHRLRNAGLALSDRRAVKLQSLFAASALLAGRQAAEISDFWVVKYIWDTEEQIDILAGIIDTLLKEQQSDQAHPQAYANKLPSAEQLLQELLQLGERLQAEDCSYEEKNLIKDQLRHLQNRAHWIQEAQQQKHLQTQIETLWQQLLETA